MILMVGVAGSGKSTQSEMLAKSDGWLWLSMGQILREKITGDLREKMNAGYLLGDEDVENILKDKLTSTMPHNKIILDGFPRRPEQAIWLLDTLKNFNDTIEAVVHLHAHKAVVKERLLARGRQDDKEDAIKERFEEYHNKVKPLLQILVEQDVPKIEIDGEGSEQEVHERIVSGLRDHDIKI